MKWMERNEGGEVVRRRIERKEGERSSSLLLSLLALLFLPPLSLLPLPPTHCLSPSFISTLLLTTSPPSFLSIHFITTYLLPSSQSSSPSHSPLPEGWRRRREG
jgi:hypothetical protein